MVRIKSWTPETGTIPYFDLVTHELMEAASRLAVEGMNLEDICNNSEEAKILRMYEQTGIAINPDLSISFEGNLRS